ncbi:MAG TPA: tetratricopeptide repeat protein, partial [Chitinophagaceae bacterium]|nr:tetratricopeptide repeat protein [Chitinophagaceae bacterium]
MPLTRPILLRLLLVGAAALIWADTTGQVNLLLHNDSARDSALARSQRDDSAFLSRDLPNAQMDTKKWSWNRRFFQNLFTRYNYYFNAETKLEESLSRVQQLYKEDYTRLLPLYPYKMSDMNLVKRDLDSVILQASLGVEIHDLRGKWIPDLYLLIGRAYYYEGSFTKATEAFQYINVHYAPKNPQDFTPVIGSAGYEPHAQISVSSPEKQQEALYRFKHHQERNDAFLWRARTMTESGDYAQALSLLNILESDPQFPQRLKGSLAEVQSYYYYSQGQYQKLKAPLEAAIRYSSDSYQKSRWEFLLAQLSQDAGDVPGAISHYTLAIRFTSEPLMDFYANFNIAMIQVNQGQGTEAKNIRALVAMARRNKYQAYRGILYYGIAKVEEGYGDDAGARYWLVQSIRASSGEPEQLTQSYQMLAGLYYKKSRFIRSYDYYDSTRIAMARWPEFPDTAAVNNRRNQLKLVVFQLGVISRQDSLQRIAVLPDSQQKAFLLRLLAERKAALKREQKALRRAQQAAQGEPAGSEIPGAASGNSGTSSGTWYFYNPVSLASGFNTFREQWGTRPLVDNWRRSAAITGLGGVSSQISRTDSIQSAAMAQAANSAAALDLASLYEGLPNTPDKLTRSNDSLIEAYFNLGRIFFEGLDNLPASIDAYETLHRRFPDNEHQQQTAYMLFLLYGRNHEQDRRDSTGKFILSKYAGSPFADLVQGGRRVSQDSLRQAEVSAFYDSTYLDYLGGDYAGVIQRKIMADHLFAGNELQDKFDLLQAMAIIHTAPDSTGMGAIAGVMRAHPNGAVHDQAAAILDALRHKQETIDYLTHLQLEPDSAQNSLTSGSGAPPASSAPVNPAPPAPRPVTGLAGSPVGPTLTPQPGIRGSIQVTGRNLPGNNQIFRIRDSINRHISDSVLEASELVRADSNSAKKRADSLKAALASARLVT